MSANFDSRCADALALALAGDKTGAMEAYRECIGLAPERIEPYLDLLQLYKDSGLEREALTLAESLLKSWPEQMSARLAAAEVFLAFNRSSDAQHLLDGIEVDCESLEYPNYLKLLLGLGRYHELLLSTRQGEHSTLWRGQARLSMAIALSNLGNTEASLALFSQLSQEGYGAEDMPLRLGLIPAWAEAYARAGRVELARMLLTDQVKMAIDPPLRKTLGAIID